VTKVTKMTEVSQKCSGRDAQQLVYKGI
jgi:hypothetical protein